jgi:hypothetical protein
VFSKRHAQKSKEYQWFFHFHRLSSYFMLIF